LQKIFDKDVLVVYKVSRIGLQLSQLASIPIILAVAGVKNKAQAIHVYMNSAPKQA
jgi:central glycolytic genes regulator